MARILVCDDDPSVRKSFEGLLRAYDHEPVIVDDAARGWELLLRGEQFKLIVSDNGMIEMRGLEFLEKIRNSPRFADFPFILMTGDLTQDVKEGCRLLGADCFDKMNMSAIIRRIMELAA